MVVLILVTSISITDLQKLLKIFVLISWYHLLIKAHFYKSYFVKNIPLL